ncbi:MAG: hypothetical protein COT84_01035 [Chlamydiae bacterium CG10_big_fil_rev_8_21_14_0_10_35_9]|nr:MAG: hypothetical protein COT84_01035 [Chlamydiae bacterium CG10_big_fil_rev_8_21_14_0_10_35_9]
MKKIFIRGLLTVAPLAITIALIVWLFTFIENAFSGPIIAIIGQKYYFTGLSVLLALVLTFMVGIVINNFIIQRIYTWAENLLKHIPLVKTLYNSVSDLMGFFKTGSKEKLGKVVMLNFNGFKILGFVTRESFEDLSDMGTKDEVAVYIPFSYQIGGYTFIVPTSHIEPVEMTVDQAMRFAITAGVLKGRSPKDKSEVH